MNTLGLLLIAYLAIGASIGVANHVITRRKLTNHPGGPFPLPPAKTMLLQSVLWHAVTWPMIATFLLMAGIVRILGPALRAFAAWYMRRNPPA